MASSIRATTVSVVFPYTLRRRYETSIMAKWSQLHRFVIFNDQSNLNDTLNLSLEELVHFGFSNAMTRGRCSFVTYFCSTPSFFTEPWILIQKNRPRRILIPTQKLHQALQIRLQLHRKLLTYTTHPQPSAYQSTYYTSRHQTLLHHQSFLPQISLSPSLLRCVHHVTISTMPTETKASMKVKIAGDPKARNLQREAAGQKLKKKLEQERQEKKGGGFMSKLLGGGGSKKK